MSGAAPVTVIVGERSHSPAEHTGPSVMQPLLISLVLFLVTCELPPHPLWSHSPTSECRPRVRFIPQHLHSHGHSLLVGWWATTHLGNVSSTSKRISHSFLCACTMFYRDSHHGHFIILTGLCILLLRIDIKDRGPGEFLSVFPWPGT